MNTDTALLIIDVQKAFQAPSWGNRNNPQAEDNMLRILEVCRNQGWTIIHIRHRSENEQSRFYIHHEGFEPQTGFEATAGEKVIEKEVNSAFIGTDLQAYLTLLQIKHVVIIGLTTPHCVSTTTRMSGNLGYQTYLVEDATAAFDLVDHHGQLIDAEQVHQLTLATLHDEFSTVLCTDELLKNIQ
ncbi:hypothetical protein A5886_001723 [Enterococcus sp. 8G7_MSG3316]|uniref:Isochorismatase-like domain-containing protein n=1 Tax=Candidatus Enterococcus testudinis TaxID=1834191 RepID=A0A242A6I1_9ENTE|nr:cysteine hydrolase family protein [Enterococcus sp. 8G7_MSG3316]OTN76645.1 hypothetical protein A5886_001723 [Enterococcus sp. 8G7_MSG3316]